MYLHPAQLNKNCFEVDVLQKIFFLLFPFLQCTYIRFIKMYIKNKRLIVLNFDRVVTFK
jgi:hypothetical protein